MNLSPPARDYYSDGRANWPQAHSGSVMLKTMSALAAAAALAGILMLVPGMSPEVEARASAPAAKGDRLDIRPLGTACAQRAWPYYEAHCVRARAGASKPSQPLRIVGADRLPN